MNIRRHTVLLIAIVAGFVLTYNTPSYGHEDSSHGPWGVSLRGAMAVYTQDLNKTGIITTGKPGPVIEGEFQYDVSNSFSVGLGTEWEYHGVRIYRGVGNIGSMTTISILPFVRYQFTANNFHPYFNLGFGYNINSFSLANTIAGVPTAGLVATVNNSLAIKPGVGLDILFADSVALNTEVDWKWNSADFIANVLAVPYVGRIGLNMNSVQFFLGVRYFF